uniref:Uncharacterized protein n=1 Tax=Opuntia streptacantha TaxID=393608 RepID=A0A7C9ESA6_OPUST
MPCWDILVCQASRDIKHNNGTLTMNVISIPKSTKLLLSCCIPAVESDLPTVSVEIQRMDFNTNGGLIFLFKFTRKMPFNECCFPCASITDKNKLEAGVINSLLVRQSHFEQIERAIKKSA